MAAVIIAAANCVGVALSSAEYAAVPLPCPPTKIPRNLATLYFVTGPYFITT